MNVIGIDVSKDALDSYDWASGSAWRLPNTSQGHAELLAQIAKADLVVLEASGGYENDVQAYLSEAGLNVAKVNPRQVRDFAKATGKLAKTDKLDAQVLAQFGFHGLAKVRAVPSLQQKELKAFVNRRAQLAEAVAREKTRAKQAKHPRLQADIALGLKQLNERIKALSESIETLLKTEFQAKAKVLRAQLGVGPVLTSTLLADLPELGSIKGKEAAALAGLAPFNNDSGGFRGRRSIRGGRASIRKALYMSIIRIIQVKEHPLTAFYQRLKEKGKSSKLAITACMRRFIVILNAKMRDALTTT